MMKTTGELASPSLAAPVSSVLPDLHRVPLAEIPDSNSVELSETLGRLLPSTESSLVPVASFNSAI
jgi:FXSXX-COOH protein